MREVERLFGGVEEGGDGRATSPGCWPPSVRVRIPMRSLIDRLVAARIGRKTNFYRDGAGAALRRERLAAYLEQRAGAPILLAAARRRATAAHAVWRLPFTSERQLTGSGPAEATATIVQRVLAELGATESVLLWNIVPTHPGTETTNRGPSRDGDHCRLGVRIRARTRPAPRSRWAGIAAETLGAPYVRHPSYGGARAFAEGLAALIA